MRLYLIFVEFAGIELKIDSMAIYRKINTNFWSDPFICDLHPEKKLFYLYLLTNERTKQCGIYDISKRQICFDLGIDLNTVTENINFFTSSNKIMFSERTNEIAIKNWERFNGSTSPKVVTCVQSELKLVKNKVLIDYIYGIYTVSQEAQAQEETPTESQAQTPKQKEAPEQITTGVLVSDELKIHPPPEKIDFNQLQKFFNDNRGLLPEVKKITDARKIKIKTIEKEYGKELIKIAIEKTRDSPFLQGQNSKNWIATFDWVFTKANFIKILEDNYAKRTNTSERTNEQIFTDAMQSQTAKEFRFK